MPKNTKATHPIPHHACNATHKGMQIASHVHFAYNASNARNNNQSYYRYYASCVITNLLAEWLAGWFLFYSNEHITLYVRVCSRFGLCVFVGLSVHILCAIRLLPLLFHFMRSVYVSHYIVYRISPLWWLFGWMVGFCVANLPPSFATYIPIVHDLFLLTAVICTHHTNMPMPMVHSHSHTFAHSCMHFP